MPWSNQGNGGGNGPWGGGGNNPWGRGGRGGGPDLDGMLKEARAAFQSGFGGPGGISPRMIGLVVLVLVALWGLSGIYTVNPDSVGVVLRFGRYVGTTRPGLNYHLPYPIEEVLTPAVTRVNKLDVGYRVGASGETMSDDDVAAQESLMLTGDENIVDINFSVFWQINDPEAYLFNIRHPEGTVKMVAESAMREIIGQLPIRAPLFENRQAINDRTRARMQELLDSYHAGITVVQVQLLKADPPAEVIDAFNDVQRAKADQERLGNEADAYRNNVVPVARGEAQRTIQEAQAYKEQVVALAQGEAKRFVSVEQAYRLAPDITSRRLYLETMEDVLKNAQKVVIDPEVRGVVPYLPLPGLKTPPAKPQGEK